MSIRRVSVRYDRRESKIRGTEVWMMRCDSCASSGRGQSWWEISTEFWEPTSGLQKCRACINTEKRLARRQTVEERRAKQRAYYRAHRAERLAWRQAYHAEHREDINRARREQYAARKEARRLPGLWDVG